MDKKVANKEFLIFLVFLYFLFKNFLVFVYQAAADLNSKFPLDYGEGPVLNSVRNMLMGINLYPAINSSPPWNVTNYPPVFYLLLTIPVKLLGINFAYGRIISTASVILSAFLIGGIVFHFFKDKIAAFLAAISFLCLPFVIVHAALGRVDSLALFFSLAGIYLVLLSDQGKIYTTIGGILFMLAVFTKPTTLVWGPFVSALFLAQKNFRNAITFLVFLYSSIICIAFALDCYTGGGFFLHTIIANFNQIELARILLVIWYLLSDLPVFIFVSIFVLVNKKFKSEFKLYYSSLFFFSLLSLILIGKKGSGYYYLFDFGAVLSIALGTAYYQMKSSTYRARLLLYSIFIVQFWYLLEISNNQNKISLPRPIPGYLSQIHELIIKQPGIFVLDDALGIELLADKPIFYQPFEMLQLVRSGHWDEASINKYLENGSISTLIMRNDRQDLTADRWSPRMLELINQYYKEESVVGSFSVKKHILTIK